MKARLSSGAAVSGEDVSARYRAREETSDVCKWYHVCPMKGFYERGLLDRRWVDRYCLGDFRRCVRYRLEARGEPHPDAMLPDGTIDANLGP